MLRNIHIKNFKSIREITVPLTNINIITGVNSSGKSSLLQTILLLKQFTKKDNKLNLNGDYAELGTIGDILNQFYEDNEIRITYNSIKNESASIIINNPDQFLTKGSITTSTTDNHKIIPSLKRRIKYLSAERMGAEFVYDISKSNFGIGIKSEQTVSFIEENKDFKVRKELIHPKANESGGRKSSLITNINEWMKEISPGINLDFEANQKLRTASMSASYYSASLIGNVTPKNFGFGISYCLPLLALLLSSKNGDILLIENPEAHIHPTGQTRLGYLSALAATSGVQLIIETHSDHFFNGIRLALKDRIIKNDEINGYYFDKKMQGEKSTQSLVTEFYKVDLYDNGKIKNAPVGFFDEWQNSLFKLL
ncbi:hypothetical protein VW41_22730 [Klebsiella michiganensis]|nr:hypothetical protein VW41_22730 [Klebsiella michiganensis]